MQQSNVIKHYGITILLIVIFLPYNTMAQKYTWKQKTNYGGGPITQGVAFSIGDKIYVGTGYNQQTGRSKQFWEYNTVTNVWTRKADFGGSARQEAVGFSINGKGYIAFGESKDIWEYDPATNTWTNKAPFPNSTRGNAAVFVVGNKAYIGTGIGGCSSPLYCKDFWEYDPAADKWTQKTDFPGIGRYGSIAFSIGNIGYMGTGTDGWTSYSDFYKYDPATDKWSAIADYPGGKRYFASAFVINNKGYVGIGMEFPPNLPTKDFWEYDPVADSWTRKEDFGGVERHYSVTAATSIKGYLGMGTGNGGSSPGDKEDFWEYSLDSVTVSDTTPHIVLEMPNVFTPNNDGMNDIFRPQQMAGVRDATLKIYNRWGQKILETKDVFTGWDGTNKNNSCADGTYFWMIDYITVTNEPKVQKGFVTMFQ